ncbi:aminopeptidase O isoform X11 [Bos indicus]|uniref:Aminopeptidase O isoform X11 n=1 Tax=Bos indicus TaxID=9915 RepID=A0ABM4SRD2_BOSIN
MDKKLDPSRDDLPLVANTSHILVKHYVLDLDVDFESQVIEGTIVLFLESGNRFKKRSSSTEVACPSESNEACKFRMPEPCQIPVTNTKTFSSKIGYNDFVICGKGEKDTSGKDGNHDNQEQASGISSSKYCCDTGNHGSEEFLLVLDCCDLSVLKVEEVDVAAVPGIEKFTRSPKLRNQIVHELMALPADRWREQLDYYARCSQAPGCGELLFDTDTWSLQIRKTGAQTATDFPHAIRIQYRTKPQGRSVTWTSDQSGRPCVYTVGSPINNRALFPCQEPPVAMSTWQATVRAAASFVVLMSGENSAKPTQLQEDYSSWHYYVTMPMPASTFTIAVGSWTEMKPEICSSNDVATERSFSPSEADFRSLIYLEWYDLKTSSFCIPHIVFLSQSTLTGMSQLCGTRLCHEIAHAWFGLAIGARDWTEEWLSEGFATHLEDVFWAKAQQQLAPHEAREQQELRACLRWRRLQDEVQNSPEEMQVLRPNKEKTGHVSDSGSSVIRHGLNPEKVFMQVHYLKGYFLLRFLAKRLGEDTYFSFLRKFVHTFHGQLILSQDFLQMLLENIPEEKRPELSVGNIFRDWLESSGIPQPLQRERQALAECGLAQQVSAEVSAGDAVHAFPFLPPRAVGPALHPWRGARDRRRRRATTVAKWVRVNRRPRKRKRKDREEVFEKLLPDQLVLLLEHLLEQKTVTPRTLQSLERIYRLSEQDAEVRHRWCELIVKHKYTKAYRDVERFLQEDQAMGIYLYGELMLSEDPRQQHLARRCFELSREQMDKSSAEVVAEMLF